MIDDINVKMTRPKKKTSIQELIDGTRKEIDCIYVRDQYGNYVVVPGDTPILGYIRYAGRPYVDYMIYVEAKYALGIRQRTI